MKERYILNDAIIYNPTGIKFNAIASIATINDIRSHKEYFGFKFELNLKQGGTVFKITKQDDNVIQGFVSVKQRENFLECANMEINKINKKPLLIHGGIGKCMIALCCKISFDLGNQGYITFEAKSMLKAYYTRFGAIQMGGLKMYIPTLPSKKLVNLYFKNRIFEI
jgi:hypothetical protein